MPVSMTLDRGGHPQGIPAPYPQRGPPFVQELKLGPGRELSPLGCWMRVGSG